MWRWWDGLKAGGGDGGVADLKGGEVITILEKFMAWAQEYPGMGQVQAFGVDDTGQMPPTGGAFPQGLLETKRQEDILGNVVQENQYQFTLRFVFEKASGDSDGSRENAEWLLGFQTWVQAQSAGRKAPAFGDTDTAHEVIQARNGKLKEASAEGTAVYTVDVFLKFKNYYEVKENG